MLADPAQSLRVVVLGALLRMLVEAPEEVPPRVPGLLADLAARYPPLQRRAMDGGALESLADLVQLPEAESCDELLVRDAGSDGGAGNATFSSKEAQHDVAPPAAAERAAFWVCARAEMEVAYMRCPQKCCCTLLAQCTAGFDARAA